MINATNYLCGTSSTSVAVDFGRFLLAAELPALGPALSSNAVALMTSGATSKIAALEATC